MADVYVNDAFAASHRAHASVVGVTLHVKEKAAGFLLQTEMEYFHKSMDEPVRPLVAIVGGAKVSSKLGALENMLDRVDRMIIGGAMANTFLKSQGFEVGASKVEDDLLETARRLSARRRGKGRQTLSARRFCGGGQFFPGCSGEKRHLQDIPENWMALDIGPATIIYFKRPWPMPVRSSGMVPMGAFEMDAFARGTMAMCQAVAASHALSVVGGGDSNAAVKKSGEEENISYMSTGGGAFLELMEGKTLPGVAALG